ncbi:hypothetical protein pdam_00004863, partial [Pocillopora damicornis]
QKGKMADGEAVINLKKLKVAELKKELADRGLSTKGNKSDLQERLEKCLADQDNWEEVGEELNFFGLSYHGVFSIQQSTPVHHPHNSTVV